MVANKPTIVKLVYDPGLDKKYWYKIASERPEAKSPKNKFFLDFVKKNL